MSLPKIQYPIFELEVPSKNISLKFRPFLVKEEKLLLIAQQSGEIKEIVLALKQIINNCCVDLDTAFDMELLTLFDVEFLFLKLRSKSVNNIVNINITDREDEKEYKLSIDLEDVKLVHNPEHSNIIDINNMKIKLRYPKVDMLDQIQRMAIDVEMFFDVMKYCFEDIEFEGTKFNFSDYSDKEVKEFIEQLNVEGFNKISKFFETMPKMYYEIKYTNSLDKEQTIVLETLADFFTLA